MEQLLQDDGMVQHITSRQAAERVGTTTTTINRWVASGRLKPAIEVPGYRGARLFTPSDVDAAAKRTEAPA